MDSSNPGEVSARTTMRVGILYSSLRGFNAVDGGIAGSLADLATGLAQAGATVRVYIVADKVPPSVPRTAGNFEIISQPAPLPAWLHRAAGRPWQLHSLTSQWYRSRVAARLVLDDHGKRPLDVIEASSSGLLALTLARTRHRPPLVTRVSTTASQLIAHNDGTFGLFSRVENILERNLALRSDSILTHSNHHRDTFCTGWRIDPARVSVIPLGIELPAAADLPRPPERETAPRILFVGRFEARKGIDTLLAALPPVLAACPSATAVLAGHDEGSYWEQKFWHDNPIVDRRRISFPGRVDAGTLRSLYRDADLFVAPSRYESFGLIYVEAMGWAKPVIGCAAGGIPEVVADGQTGLLIQPGDTKGLISHLLTLLRDAELRRQFGRAGRERAEHLFTREAMAASSLAHYASLAARRAHRA